jgi:hypothetical protein
MNAIELREISKGSGSHPAGTAAMDQAVAESPTHHGPNSDDLRC